MAQTITVIPRPVFISYTEGFFECGGMPSITGDVAFQKEIDTASGQYWGSLTVKAEFRIVCKQENLFAGSVKAAEGYHVCISRDSITVRAASGAGCYHGLQTVRQLFLSENRDGVITLPCAEIEDYPRFTWRGYMLDSARHFFPVPVVKKLIDAISLHHINHFHWHLTDVEGWRFPVSGYPLLIEAGRNVSKNWHDPKFEALYTVEDLKDLVAFAAARHIEIIPEVEFPGHSSAALAAYPELRCVDLADGGVYCAGNDGMFDFAAAVFDTLAGIFPSPYVHFGGDEVYFGYWEKCPRCQKRLAELGLETPRELQSWITMKLARMLEERGKTAIGWDEILEDTEQYKLPQSTVVMSWRGAEGGIQASALGHKVIMCPASDGCYFDYKLWDCPEEMGWIGGQKQTRGLGMTPVIQTYEMDPVVPGMNESQAALILGGQGNLWTAEVHTGRAAEYMTFPRICALSEALWTPKEQKNFDDFKARLKSHEKRLDALNILYYRGPLN